jgi:hypothetical protein
LEAEIITQRKELEKREKSQTIHIKEIYEDLNNIEVDLGQEER